MNISTMDLRPDTSQGFSARGDYIAGHEHLWQTFIAPRLVKGTLLDVGCGEGGIRNYLPGIISHYVGVDKCSVAIEIAKMIHWKDEFYAVGANNLGPDMGVFDNILFCQSLEHITTPTLPYIPAMMPRSGRLIVSTPQPGSDNEKAHVEKLKCRSVSKADLLDIFPGIAWEHTEHGHVMLSVGRKA